MPRTRRIQRSITTASEKSDTIFVGRFTPKH